MSKEKREKAEELFLEIQADLDAAEEKMTPLIEEFEAVLKKMAAVAEEHQVPVSVEFAGVDFPYTPKSFTMRERKLEDLDEECEFVDELSDSLPRRPYYENHGWMKIWNTSSLYC